MKNIPKLFRYLNGYGGKVALYFCFSLLAVVFSLFTFSMLAPVLQVIFEVNQVPSNNEGLAARLTQYVNNFILDYNKMTALSFSVLIILFFTLFKNLFFYLSLRILSPIRNGIVRKLRDDMFSKALSLPVAYFSEEKKGDLVSKMTNDVNEVEVSIISVVETLIREPITIVLTIVSMLLISPSLTLFLLFFLPLAGFIIGKVGRSLKKPSNLAQEQLGEMLGTIDEAISGIRIIKSFNAERHIQLRFRQINHLLLRAKNKIAARKDAGSPLSETLGILVVCVILWYGGWLIFSGKSSLTGPLFMVFIAFFYQIINPLKNLSTAFYNMQKGAAAMDRIENLLATDAQVKEIEKSRAIHEFKEAIEFKNVSFAYGQKKVLNNISLKIKKGQTIALVGASGAGKSTMADLIPRFHDVTEGEILIDGTPIQEYKLYDLRRLMGVVSQEPMLFNDTIYDNVTLGTGGASEAQVHEAAKHANAHDFIIKKKEGYQTLVGDRGAKLSGGERQRITIARALLKNPPILILDEATSSLDTHSEKIVQEAINTLMKNRTCIVIAHRLSTVQHADEIIVMKQGEIIERGNHHSLMSNPDSEYYHLVMMQQIQVSQ